MKSETIWRSEQSFLCGYSMRNKFSLQSNSFTWYTIWSSAHKESQPFLCDVIFFHLGSQDLACLSEYFILFFIFTVWRVSFLFLFLFMFLIKAVLLRQILMEGPLQLLDSGKAPEMFVILFDDMLLITRKKKGLSKKVSPHNPLWGPLFYSSLISLILVLTSSAFFVVVISQIFSTQWTKTLDTFPVRQSHGCPHRTS